MPTSDFFDLRIGWKRRTATVDSQICVSDITAIWLRCAALRGRRYSSEEWILGLLRRFLAATDAADLGSLRGVQLLHQIESGSRRVAGEELWAEYGVQLAAVLNIVGIVVAGAGEGWHRDSANGQC